MKYFITGGAGFIGRELVKQILVEKHSVTIYDNFSFGRIENIEEFKSDPLLIIIRGDITNYNDLFKIVKNAKPDIVIHLAALHFIPFCNANPTETIRNNVEGTYGIFEAASKLGVKRVLFASSGAIYASETYPLDEKKDIPQPVDVYGCSKLLGESICEYFSRKSDMQVITMRFFNTYGPYETNEHLIPEIMKQLHNGNVLRLGNMMTKRDYIFTEDIVRGIILLSQSKIFKNNFEIVNIGSGYEYSGEEIIECIGSILNRKILLELDPERMRNSDKMHQIASLKHIEELTNWRPKYSIIEGLRKLLLHEALL